MVARTVDEVVEAVRAPGSLRIIGQGSREPFRVPIVADRVLQVGLSGVIEHDAPDQVVRVYAGTTIAELQDALLAKGQCLPLAIDSLDARGKLREHTGTVGGELSMNLPHAYEAQCGCWRDWVIGLTLVRPDGTVVKCGSRTVKNVAGYDVGKLVVGGRGTLGVVVEVILRTYPFEALGDPDLVLGSAATSDSGIIQRTLFTDFEATKAKVGESLIAAYPGTATLKFLGEAVANVDGWSLGWGLGQGNLGVQDPTLRFLMQKARALFDPEGKLNAGEFGDV